MKRWLKLGAWIFGGLVVVLVGAVVALKVLFPPKKVQAMALEKLEASLGREVRLKAASIGLRGVSLSGLEISQEPDFKAGTFLKAEDLQLAVRLRPLITQHELQVVKCSLSDWSIDYTAKPPTKKKKAAPAKKEPPKNSGAAAAPQINVAKLSLQDGSIRYRDRKAGTDVKFSQITLSASDVRLDGPFNASLSFAFRSGRGKAARSATVAFKGSVDPASGELSKLVLKAAPLSLKTEGISIKISGTVKNADKPEFALKLKMPAIPANKLHKLAGTPKGMSLPAVKGALKARMTGTAGDVVRIKRFALASGGLSLSASGRILLANKKRKEPVLNLSLKSNKFDLTRLVEIYPAVKEYGLAGTTDFKLKAKGKASAPALSGKIKLDKAAFSSAGQKFSGVNGAVDLTPKKIEGGLKGKWNSGDLDIKLSAFGYKGPRPKFTFNGTVTVLDLTTLPGGEKSSPAKKPAQKGKAPPKKQKKTRPIAASGSVVIGEILHPNFKASRTKFDWDLKNVSTDLSKLGGTIKFRVGSGQFDDLKALAKDKPIVKVILLPVMVLQKAGGLVKVPLFPKFDRVEFKEIVGDYSIRKGDLTVKKSRLDSAIALVDMTGTADLGKDKLDLAMTARLGTHRGLPIKFKVMGSLSDPKVKLDAKALFKQPAVSDALRKGEKLLRGLFKR